MISGFLICDFLIFKFKTSTILDFVKSNTTFLNELDLSTISNV